MRDCGEEKYDGVDKGALELCIRTDVLILFRQVTLVQANIIQRVVVDSQEDDDLPEEGNPEPKVPDGMRRASAGDLL